MSNHYYNLPIGIRNRDIPLAAIAEAKTSRQLVDESEKDSGFFEAWSSTAFHLIGRKLLPFATILDLH